MSTHRAIHWKNFTAATRSPALIVGDVSFVDIEVLDDTDTLVGCVGSPPHEFTVEPGMSIYVRADYHEALSIYRGSSPMLLAPSDMLTARIAP